MKTNKLKTTINHRLIYKQKHLSYHTKCILQKITTDILCGHEEAHFIYLEDNIFNIWPEQIVWDALEELAEAEIMCIHISDDEEEEDTCEEECECEIEDGALIFNPEYLEKVCVPFGHCECCDPAPKNFNVNYN